MTNKLFEKECEKEKEKEGLRLASLGMRYPRGLTAASNPAVNRRARATPGGKPPGYIKSAG